MRMKTFKLFSPDPPAPVTPPAPPVTPPVADPPAPPVTPPVTPPAAPPVTPPDPGQPQGTPPAAPVVKPAGADPAPPTPPAGPPATYALEVPAGVPAALVEKLKVEARTLGLTNEEAQVGLENMLDALNANDAEQRTALESHPELGGEHLAATEANVTRALKFIFNDAERQAFHEETVVRGVQNNPMIALAFARLGKALAEDGAVVGRSASGPKSVEEQWYGAGKGADPKPQRKP
jgi:hypothetical protein